MHDSGSLGLPLAAAAEPRASSHRGEARPVLWWAALGAIFVVFAAYVQGRWLLGGQAHHVGTGVTPEPLYAKISVIGNQIVFGVGSLVCLYIAVIRPKIKTGRIGYNGLLYLAFFFVWWQDVLFNFISGGFAYNALFLNLGGWGPNIPGWGSPNGGNSATPIIWNLGFYLFASFAECIAASKIMNGAKARWPRLKTPVMLAIYFVILFVLDCLAEFFWVVTGCYAYPGTRSSWTLFEGHYYQYPLYEPLVAALAFLAWTSLVHFKNKHGETLVEMGLSRVHVRPGRRQFLRFLALVAGLNVAFLIFYDAPINIWQSKISYWPASIQSKSYMTHGMCGEGTNVICGGRGLQVGPDGKVPVPRTVPFKR